MELGLIVNKIGFNHGVMIADVACFCCFFADSDVFMAI